MMVLKWTRHLLRSWNHNCFPFAIWQLSAQYASSQRSTNTHNMKAFLIFIISFVRQSHEQPNVVCHRRRVGVVVCTFYLVCSSRTPSYQMRSTIFRVSFAPLLFLFSLTLVLFYLVFRSVPFRFGFWCFVAVSIHLFSSYIRWCSAFQ